jgi:HSP20 family protein
MAEAATKLPVKSETTPSGLRSPIANLRREFDRLFDEMNAPFWPTPFHRSLFDYMPFGRAEAAVNVPAVDIEEKDNAYEITAELPGMDEKDVEVKLSNGGLLIKGEKKSEKEEKKKNYYLSERSYGSFERYFGLPEDVDADKIVASFKKGVLTVTLPKSAQAKPSEKKIAIKSN